MCVIGTSGETEEGQGTKGQIFPRCLSRRVTAQERKNFVIKWPPKKRLSVPLSEEQCRRESVCLRTDTHTTLISIWNVRGQNTELLLSGQVPPLMLFESLNTPITEVSTPTGTVYTHRDCVYPQDCLTHLQLNVGHQQPILTDPQQSS